MALPLQVQEAADTAFLEVSAEARMAEGAVLGEVEMAARFHHQPIHLGAQSPESNAVGRGHFEVERQGVPRPIQALPDGSQPQREAVILGGDSLTGSVGGRFPAREIAVP